MKRKLSLLLLMFAFGDVYAGQIVTGAQVIAVVNTSGNEDVYQVKTTGGADNKCEGKYIQFPVSDSANKETHARGYTTALTALTNGLKVTIYNYVDQNCNDASFIEITK